MNLIDVRAQFAAGCISKSDYIEQSLALHQKLFEYSDIIRATDIQEISIDQDGVSFIIGQERIKLHSPPNEARVAPLEIMNFGKYEPEETRVMALLCARAATILDVGANIGWFSLKLARQNTSARVYAFEPIPSTFLYLQKSLAANEMGSRIASFNYGLSDASGVVDFFIVPTGSTNASLKNVSESQNAQPVKSLVLTLDSWCKNFGVVPDFIKCDVEGAEILVFKGGNDTLRRHRPVIFCEMLRKWTKPFGYHPNDTIMLLSDIGYKCFAIGSNGCRPIKSMDDETIETNFVFLDQSKHVQLSEEIL